MKDKLINELYNFWSTMDDDNDKLKEEISNLVYNEGVDGAIILLDWCRGDYDTIRDMYMAKYNLNEDQMEEIMEKNCGTYDFMIGEVDYDINGLDEIWDLCNYYFDYCNGDITEETLISIGGLK